jgi:hypothetical protein
MARVLRLGGLLLLADHIAGATWPVRAIQRMIDVVTVPLQREHYLRRPFVRSGPKGSRLSGVSVSSSGSWNGSPPANPPPAGSVSRDSLPALGFRAPVMVGASRVLRTLERHRPRSPPMEEP